MACGAAGRLCERPHIAQETLLVGIHDGHQGDLRQVQTFTQEVHPHEHVDGTGTQVLQNLHSVKRFHVGVDVTGADPDIDQIRVELFGHALGQGRHQHAFAFIHSVFDFVEQVVHLISGGAHLYRGIQQTGRPDHLFDHYPTRLFQLVVCRRGTHIDGLPHQRFELVELQRTVVQSGGQTESVLHQVDFTGAVAAVHGPDLRHSDVAFVYHQHEILGKEVEDAERAHSWLALVEVAGIILNARTVTQLLHHLHIIRHAIFQPFGFQMFANGFEVVALFAQIQYNLVDSLVHGLLCRHEKAGRIDDQLFLFRDDPAGCSLYNRQ